MPAIIYNDLSSVTTEKHLKRSKESFSAGRKKAAPKSRLQLVWMLLGLLGGLERLAHALALAGFNRYRVVDLANVVGLD